jgi:hypothetical protein
MIEVYDDIETFEAWCHDDWKKLGEMLDEE